MALKFFYINLKKQMKWLFKFLLFKCILLSAGPSHRPLSSPEFRFEDRAVLIDYQPNSSNTILTSVMPERDGRVFQVVEDEEDNTTSRVKKNTSLIIFAGTFFGGNTSVFCNYNCTKTPLYYACTSFNSHPRYIQLRTIRV